MYVRAKICGITSVKDALIAVEAGADAIGLVFYAPSPRNVALEAAIEIANALPPFVSLVGLFVNAEKTEIDHVLAKVPLTILQFHGDETALDCQQFSLPYFKAIRVKSDTNLVQCAIDFRSAIALLLDTYSESAFGGTGLSFDWNLIPKNLPKPIILAGGLSAENIASAIKQVQPYAVDVSGSVELSKGLKDPIKVKTFMQTVKDTRSI